MLEVKERIKLNTLRIDHVMIRSKLKYFIGAKVVGAVKCNCGPVRTHLRTLWVPLFLGNNLVWTIWTGSKHGPQPGNLELLLTLVTSKGHSMPISQHYHMNNPQSHTIVLRPSRKMRLQYLQPNLLPLWTSFHYNDKAVYLPPSSN
jgi:hypothetical protein